MGAEKWEKNSCCNISDSLELSTTQAEERLFTFARASVYWVKPLTKMEKM